MTGKTHLLFGASMAVTTACFFNIEDPSTFVIMSSVGALIPDIDNPKSVVGRLLPFISIPLNKSIGHRTYLHDITFYLPFFLLAFIFGPDKLGLLFGIYSHLFLDMFTAGGIRCFYSKKKKEKYKDKNKAISLTNIKYGSFLEYPLAGILYFICASLTVCLQITIQAVAALT